MSRASALLYGGCMIPLLIVFILGMFGTFMLLGKIDIENRMKKESQNEDKKRDKSSSRLG